MDRLQKTEVVHSLKESLQGAVVVVVTKQHGLTVSEVTELRRKMRISGASFKVVKNNLARLAVQGTELEELSPYFTGPTALAYSTDPVAAARIAFKFSEENGKLSIAGGILSGQLMDVKAIEALAKLPSLDEIRARLAGLLNEPAAQIARILIEPGTCIARVLNARL